MLAYFLRDRRHFTQMQPKPAILFRNKYGWPASICKRLPRGAIKTIFTFTQRP
jgi:hypothetical protein